MQKLTSGLPALLGGGEKDRIRILDVGSGAGGSAFHLAKMLRAAEVTGVDLSANMVQIAEERKGEQEEEVTRAENKGSKIFKEAFSGPPKSPIPARRRCRRKATLSIQLL